MLELMERMMDNLDDAFQDFTGNRKKHLDNWIDFHKKFPNGRQMGSTLSEVRIDHRNRYSLALKHILKNQFTNKVLDLGGGTGYGSFMLSEHIENIDCVDISSQAKQIHDSSYNKENINYILGNALTVKYNPPYDCIVTFEFLEHVEAASDIIKMCGEFSNHIISSVPNETTHHFNPASQVSHVRHYTESEFKELLAMGGFTVTEMYTQVSTDSKGAKVVKGNHGRHLIAIAEK